MQHPVTTLTRIVSWLGVVSAVLGVVATLRLPVNDTPWVGIIFFMLMIIGIQVVPIAGFFFPREGRAWSPSTRSLWIAWVLLAVPVVALGLWCGLYAMITRFL